MVNLVGIAVRVDYGEDFNSHSLRFSDANVFTANVDNEYSLWNLCHIPHACEVFLQAVEGVT